MCMWCEHYGKGEPTDPDEHGFYCRAFPGGIPDAIVFGDHDHREPFEGDRETLFRLKAGEELPAYIDEDPPEEDSVIETRLVRMRAESDGTLGDAAFPDRCHVPHCRFVKGRATIPAC